jgi:O-antigen/teichoic acid export membrane protein
VAYKLFEPTLIVPGVLLAATFPLLARSAHMEAIKPNALRELLGQTTLALLGLGALATLLLILLAGPMIALLYGPTYAASAPILAWLALACVPMYINYGLTHALIATDRPRLYALFTLAALSVNLGLNLALIPVIGLVGAALTTVAAELTLLILCAIAVYRYLSTLKSQSAPLVGVSSKHPNNPQSGYVRGDRNPQSADLELPT